VKVSMV